MSRWQHPNDKPIDFSVAYASGLRFVMIKASDTRDEADALALKYLIMDHAAAQAAGLYTGFITMRFCLMSVIQQESSVMQLPKLKSIMEISCYRWLH